MVVIYCRHENDEWKEPQYQHDCSINDQGRKHAKKAGKALAKRYGNPDIIIASPMMRGKQTAEALTTSLANKPTIVYDSDLSRFFSYKEKADPQINPETNIKMVPIQESKEEFQRRCRQHIKKMHREGYYTSDIVVWCITHALVLKEIAAFFEVEMDHHIKFLDHFYVRRK